MDKCPCEPVLSSLAHTPRSGLAGSLGGHFVRNCLAVSKAAAPMCAPTDRQEGPHRRPHGVSPEGLARLLHSVCQHLSALLPPWALTHSNSRQTPGTALQPTYGPDPSVSAPGSPLVPPPTRIASRPASPSPRPAPLRQRHTHLNSFCSVLLGPHLQACFFQSTLLAELFLKNKS